MLTSFENRPPQTEVKKIRKSSTPLLCRKQFADKIKASHILSSLERYTCIQSIYRHTEDLIPPGHVIKTGIDCKS